MDTVREMPIIGSIVRALETRGDLLGSIIGFYGTMEYNPKFLMSEIEKLVRQPSVPTIHGFFWNLNQGPLIASIGGIIAGYILGELDIPELSPIGNAIKKIGYGALAGTAMAALVRAAHQSPSATSSRSPTSTAYNPYAVAR